MSSKRDWTEDLPELFEGYTEAAPEGLWEAVEAGSGPAAGRRRIAGWWYAGGALLAAAAAVVAAVVLFRPAADPSVVNAEVGDLVAQESVGSDTVSPVEEAAQLAPASPDASSSFYPSATPAPSQPENPVGWAPPVTVQTTAKPVGQTPEGQNLWMETDETKETATDQPKTTVVPLEREPLKPFKPRQRQRIRVQAGVFGSGLMAQNVVQSGQTATHVASMLGSAPAIQTKSISGGPTTFDPSIIGRNKPAITQNNHRQSARLGVGVKVNFLPHWGVESGLTFTTLNSTFETTRGNSTQIAEQELHYLGIPLHLHFNALQWRGVGVYLAAGPMYEFTNETSESFSTRLNGRLISSATDNTLQKDHRWSVNIDAGLQLEFMENNAIYIQPGFSYHFPQQQVPTNLQSYYTERPASFNLTIGYRLLL